MGRNCKYATEELRQQALKEQRKKYRESENGRRVRDEYRRSPKGIEVQRISNQNYVKRHGDERKKYDDEYKRTHREEIRIAANARNNIRYSDEVKYQEILEYNRIWRKENPDKMQEYYRRRKQKRIEDGHKAVDLYLYEGLKV